MDEAKNVARNGAPTGTVIVADEQTSGRGRAPGRVWYAEAGAGLLCTVVLRVAPPVAFTLRAGLALVAGIERAFPTLAGRCVIKWPNDVLIQNPTSIKKVAGILTENDGTALLVGFGVNIYAADLQRVPTAGSLFSESEGPEQRWKLLDALLPCLEEEVETGNASWRARLLARLYGRGQWVTFQTGGAEGGEQVRGVLAGVSPRGGIIIATNGEETKEYITGELLWR
jgi:BirA family biotin operon repressor/biotin-[acetyl-CoA-carboxylase] ligase